MTRVGLVGYGLGGRVFHAPLIVRAEGLALAAVCSRSEARRNEAHGDYPDARPVERFDDLLAMDDIDMVALSTPHDTHCEMSCRAMEAGKHVVTDKVMCLDAGEAERMIETARRNGVVLSVFQNRRWDGDFLTLRKLLNEGVLGEIYTVESNITTFGGAHSGWRAWEKHGGGRVRDWGAHIVDQALQLFGTVASVSADFEYHYPPDRADVESAAHITLRFQDGPRFVIELGSHWMFPKPRFLVMGAEGGFRKYGVDPQEAAMKLGTFGASIPEDPARYQLKLRGDQGPYERNLQPEPGCYSIYYGNVAKAIRGEEELMVKPEECLAAVRVIDAIRASAKTEQVVKLNGA